MLNDEFASNRQRVWVLMFDRLPFDRPVSQSQVVQDPGSIEETTPVQYSSIDDLDLRSTFFEQYLIQDVSESATVVDVLGGAGVVHQFCEQLDQGAYAVAHIRLTCGGSVSSDPALTSTGAWLLPQTSNSRTAEYLIQTAESGTAERELNTVFDLNLLDLDLVWFDVKISLPDEDCVIADSIVRWLRQHRSQVMHDCVTPLVLIVSSQRGYERSIKDPFFTSCDEGLIHAPLWIERPAGHSCRVQSLAASFDLLPTVLEFLTGMTQQALITDSIDDRATHVLTELSGQSLSLASAIQSFCPGKDRLIRLKGKNWTALRSQQYLLVFPEDVAPNDTEVDRTTSADRHQRPARKLFLKPDDIWNVHDVIVTYESIADEMQSLASQGSSE